MAVRRGGAEKARAGDLIPLSDFTLSKTPAELRAIRENMEVFDRLPPELREMLAGALHSVEPVQPILTAYWELVGIVPHFMAVQHIGHHLAQAEAVGIARAARRYREQTGRPYPHTEAMATICRPTSTCY